MPDDAAPAAAPPQENGSGKAKSGGGGRSSSHKQRSYLPDVHRSLPASVDAEKGVLASILLSPDSVIDECLERRLGAEHFHLPAHAVIFEAAREMRDALKPIDLISITQYLEDTKRLESAGGAGSIADLYSFVPTAANAAYYIQIVREKYLLRRIITTCNEFAARAHDEQGTVETLLDEVESRVLHIGDERFDETTKDMRALTVEAIDRIDKIFRNRGAITGLSTGFSVLDKMTDGLHPQEMFVLAARPSMGKTALAMNIAEHVALVGRRKVAVYSLEMSTQQLVQRMLCSKARVNLKHVQQEQQYGTKKEMTRLYDAANQLADSQMFIDDTPALPILQLRARCRRLHQRCGGLDLVVIDYLQLLHSSVKSSKDNRQVEVAEISAGIKALAKELEIPIIALAQLNRNPEARTGSSKGVPKLSDLRESGSIEQDADVVALLWRENYYADDEEKKEESEGRAELIIAKQRNGPTGNVPLTFIKDFTRFEDRAPDRE
jgi:replicative DNA helicase